MNCFDLAISSHRKFTPSVNNRAVAASILTNMLDYYDFNNTETSSLSIRTWINTYGGTVFDYSMGIINYKARHHVYNRTPWGGYTSGNPFSYGMVLDCTPYTSKDIYAGAGEQELYCVTLRAGVNISTNGSNVMTARLYCHDYGTGLEYTGVGQVISPGSHLFGISYAPSTKTLSLNIDGAHVESKIVGAHFPDPSITFLTISDTLTQYGGPWLGAFTAIPYALSDEWFTRQAETTDAMFDYYYNGGAFKSYAQILADSI